VQASSFRSLNVLQIAIVDCREEVTAFLLSHDNSSLSLLKSLTPKGRNVLHIAAAAGNDAIVEVWFCFLDL
jgi:hypothetical protein